MAEFVAHEIEIAAVDCRGSDKADHLVESHAACHGHIVVADHHVPVHLVVDEAEYDGLVADKRLIVAFDI